ncbi:hypothetical protein [Lentzea sp. NPDC055074]
MTETVGGWNWSGPLELSGRLAELVDMGFVRIDEDGRARRSSALLRALTSDMPGVARTGTPPCLG